MSRRKTQAVAYLRTSSAVNIGPDKDSDRRQRDAIQRFAKGAGYEVVAEFNDAAVSGADPLEARPGFAALLDRIEDNGVKTVLVEDASRLARDLITQELGIVSLVARQVRVLTSNGDDLTATDDHFKVAMRQIAGAFAQLEKARLVAKLRHARERMRKERGKCEGRKSLADVNPEAVALAKRLRRASAKRGKRGEQRRLSLRRISAQLAAAGHLNERGRPFNHLSIAKMVGEA